MYKNIFIKQKWLNDEESEDKLHLWIYFCMQIYFIRLYLWFKNV
jgi:hypothetical protein